METHLAALLEELRSERLEFGANAANENMRAVTVTGARAQSIREFLESASTIYLEHARDSGVSPATFYAWCDEQAGQLRFSIAPCTSESLPFEGRVQLIRSPGPIADLAVATGDLIPCEELHDVPYGEAQKETEPPHSLVWARTEEAG